jgi:transcriptional antiterminator Rof (Rho-off)
MMMSTNLKVIDFPYYPAQPEKSKAVMMVILSFLIGLVLPASGLVAMEILDGSLKTPKNAVEQTGLKLAGILPQFPKNPAKHPVDFDQLSKQALNLFVQELRILAQGRVQVRVTLASIQPGEGKSNLIDALERHLSEYFPQCQNQFEFLEIPSLLHHPFHLEVEEGEIFLLVARADRKWTEADQHALKVFKKFIGKKPILFLNRVRTDIMEEITGEVPRKRSWLRSKVKSLLS